MPGEVRRSSSSDLQAVARPNTIGAEISFRCLDQSPLVFEIKHRRPKNERFTLPGKKPEAADEIFFLDEFLGKRISPALAESH